LCRRGRPTRPSGFDIEAIQTTLEMAEFAKRQAVVVVNAVPCNRVHLGVTTVAGLRQRGFSGGPIKAATVTKANDQPEGPLTSYKLEPFDFKPDEDGDPFRTRK